VVSCNSVGRFGEGTDIMFWRRLSDQGELSEYISPRAAMQNIHANTDVGTRSRKKVSAFGLITVLVLRLFGLLKYAKDSLPLFVDGVLQQRGSFVSLLAHDIELEIIQSSNIDAKGLALSYGLKQNKRQCKNYQSGNGQTPPISNERGVKSRLIDGGARSIGMDIATRPEIADGHLQQERPADTIFIQDTAIKMEKTLNAHNVHG
ncbi:hypothetical protein Tco_0775006, partial [Tanacetum coccineum]